MGLMDFFIRPEPVSYGTAKGLNTLQINRIAADLRTARDSTLWTILAHLSRVTPVIRFLWILTRLSTR